MKRICMQYGIFRRKDNRKLEKSFTRLNNFWLNWTPVAGSSLRFDGCGEAN